MYVFLSSSFLSMAGITLTVSLLHDYRVNRIMLHRHDNIKKKTDKSISVCISNTYKLHPVATNL
jgi:hypothetical protein